MIPAGFVVGRDVLNARKAQRLVFKVNQHNVIDAGHRVFLAGRHGMQI
jgi:hypothetical protein